jgi:DNA-binding response OmpR family regulator
MARILVSSECRNTRREVSDCLEDAGASVLPQDSVKGMLDVLFQGHAIDLLVMDAAHNLASAAKVVGLLRDVRVFKKLPIILLTNGDERNAAGRSGECGATRCMKKPFQAKHLLGVAKSLLATSGDP